MAQYAVPRQNEPQRYEHAVADVASPAPLGLGVMAFATAILGCFYTGFIIPFNQAGIRPAVGVVALISGIILVLAGMWEYRKGYLMTATAFTAYGGLLGIVGLIFIPNFGVMPALSGNVRWLLGLVYLCWAISLGLFTIGATRVNASLVITLGVLFLAFFFLMLGSLANNTVLLRVGGWCAIASALIAWLACIASLLGTATPNAAYSLPFGRRVAVVEHSAEFH